MIYNTKRGAQRMSETQIKRIHSNKRLRPNYLLNRLEVIAIGACIFSIMFGLTAGLSA